MGCFAQAAWGSYSPRETAGQGGRIGTLRPDPECGHSCPQQRRSVALDTIRIVERSELAEGEQYKSCQLEQQKSCPRGGLLCKLDRNVRAPAAAAIMVGGFKNEKCPQRPWAL